MIRLLRTPGTRTRRFAVHIAMRLPERLRFEVLLFLRPDTRYCKKDYNA